MPVYILCPISTGNDIHTNIIFNIGDIKMSKVKKYNPINSDLLTRVTVTVSTNAVNLLHKYSAELQQPNSWLLYRLACSHNTKAYTSTSTKKQTLQT